MFRHSRNWLSVLEVEQELEGQTKVAAKKFTAEEMWGRIETEHCISAANMFKNAGSNNGIIISKKHSVLDLG